MQWECNAVKVDGLAGRQDILTVASALARLRARTIWKLTKQEVAAAGGLEALNLTANVKV